MAKILPPERRIDWITPRPRRITRLEGRFTWNASSFLLTDHLDPELAFATEQFLDTCRQCGLPRPRSARWAEYRPDDAAILIGQRDRMPVSNSILDTLSEPLPDYLGEEGYWLEITPRRLILIADTSAGVYYGAQTLAAMLQPGGEPSLPALRIHDWPGIPLRGYMQDMGRGQTPTLETLKRTIERMGALKLNAYFAYLEDGFHFLSQPAIGRERDRLEPGEAEELVAHARRHHVRIVPLPQSTAHMPGLLSLPEYQHLREGEDERLRAILNLYHPETLPLLESMYRDLAQVFPDPLFFPATDECFGIGRGAAKPVADHLEEGGLFVGHVKKLREILLRLDKRMIFSPDPVEPDFYRQFGLTGFAEKFLKRVPRDIIHAPWHYGHMEQFPYGELLNSMGIDMILWGSAGHSSPIHPDIWSAADNAGSYMGLGHSLRAMGGVVSQWDGLPGRSGLVEFDWPIYAYFAEALWTPNPRSIDDFLPTWLAGWLGAPDAARLADGLRAISQTDRAIDWGGGFLQSASRVQFYRPIEPHALDESQQRDLEAWRDQIAEANRVFEESQENVPRQADYIRAHGFALHQAAMLGQLIDARDRLARGRLREGDRRELARSIAELRDEFATLWRPVYKPRILPLNLHRYDRLIQSMLGESTTPSR